MPPDAALQRMLEVRTVMPTTSMPSATLPIQNMKYVLLGPQLFDPHVVDRSALGAAVNALSEKCMLRRRTTRSKSTSSANQKSGKVTLTSDQGRVRQ